MSRNANRKAPFKIFPQNYPPEILVTQVDSTQLWQDEIGQLGPWFQNLHLPQDVQTVADHPLGDFPRNKWQAIADHLPPDLTGWSALDVGCNAGFYSFELARRGARVTAIDRDSHYLQQARWAARILQLDQQVTFEQNQVYSLAHRSVKYDIVWFMGVFYHLRYPLLALDILARMTGKLMVFQSLTLPGDESVEVPPDLALNQRHQMLQEGWPKMAFIEKRVADDPTNWWAPNHACVEAMLRSCGLRVIARPAHEIYVCEVGERLADGLQALNDEQFLAATGQGGTTSRAGG